MNPLPPQIVAFTRSQTCLVACDFDGTLSPLVTDPAAAMPAAGAIAVLSALASLRDTHVAIISGRGLDDLRARLTGLGESVALVGSHGAEESGGSGVELPLAALELRSRLIEALDRISRTIPGTQVERKPVSAALHFREASKAGAADAYEQALAVAHSEPGARLRLGSKVVEMLVIDADKGTALRRLAHHLNATSIVFVGDDVTDEDAFGVLGPADAGVKVGDGPTLAALRVDSPAEVVEMLEAITLERAARVGAMPAVPIQHHSLLSDQRTLALVTPDARITWLCLPRIDSGSVFAELLDTGGSAGGAFAVNHAGGEAPLEQVYDGDSFVLTTRWPGFTVTDYMDCSGGRAWQRAGRCDLVRVLEGRGSVRVSFAPRLDFGRVGTRILVHPDGLEVEGQSDPIVLFSPGVEWTIRDDNGHQTADATIELSGTARVLEIRSGTWNLRPQVTSEPDRRAQTRQFWSGWARALIVPPLKGHLVRRSALVLKALCHGPSGAFAAAATTSLPEHIGGIRNWDYRFCWPRDAAMSAAALVRLGNTGHALKLLDWLLGVVDKCESPDRLRPIYTVTGGMLGSEGEISGLMGYAGSQPVRIGNAAANQVQLDVFAPVVDLVALLAERGAPISPDHWRLVRSMLHAVEARWAEPDHGIWEIRGPKQHHVHSKVMCWHAVTRGLVVEEFVTGRRTAHYDRLREEIASDILSNGWNPELNSFTIAFGVPSLDAASLAVGLTGLLPPDDPRFIATIERVQQTLQCAGGVYRYHADDGLPGEEGTFLLCTAWLIESLVLIGRIAEARELFERYAALAGPTGLLAEENDPTTQRALGNFPQAYSHLGLINCALALSAAGERD